MSDAGLGPRVSDLPGTERDGRDDAALVAQSVKASGGDNAAQLAKLNRQVEIWGS
jgi:hypothetical protein